MKTILYTAAALFAFTACHHQKAATASATPPPPPPVTYTTTQGDVQITTDESTTATISVYNPPDSVTTTVVAPDAQTTVDTSQVIYRISVSFISKGAGIDAKTEEDFEKWLQDYPKHPAYEKTHWGREGEVNLCLKLGELSTREQEIFVRDVRTKLAGNELVFVTENVPCKGHR